MEKHQPTVDRPFYFDRIFWDVDVKKMDFTLRANFIIERVFERGDVEDIRYCRRYYGDEKISIAILKAKFIPWNRIHLASAIIDKPLEEFKCYKLRQSNPELFPY